jgi:hypothetical protein
LKVTGDVGREHLDPKDPETLVKVAAVTAALTHVKFASHEIHDVGDKAAFKAKAEEIAQALVFALGHERSLRSS